MQTNRRKFLSMMTVTAAAMTSAAAATAEAAPTNNETAAKEMAASLSLWYDRPPKTGWKPCR